LREVYRLRVLEKRVLRKIFGSACSIYEGEERFMLDFEGVA
jgi:hypothetical protein